MTFKNYTGQNIGLTDKSGNPIRVLPSEGKAEVVAIEEQLIRTNDLIPIYRRSRGIVKYLPQPDGNQNTMYIVNKEVAAAARGRIDILIVDDPFEWKGGTFYRKVVNF